MADNGHVQTLYYNGDILTMEDKRPCVQALLTENGKIVAAGDYGEIKDRADPGVRRADLEGAVLMPGFIDPHSHFTACASRTMEADLSKAKDFDDIVGSIRTFIADRKIKRGEWIQAADYDHNNLKEGVHPRREVLDRAAPDNPLIVKHQSGHMGVFNTMAMELLGVTNRTEAPSGGMLEKQDGAPSGYMEETAFLEWQGRVPMPSATDYLKAYESAQELYASCGITTVQEGMMPSQLIPLYKMLIGSGLLKLDLVAYMDMRESGNVAEEFIDHVGQYKSHVKIGGYKMFLDGSPQGRTAWLRQPYRTEPRTGQPEDYRGYGTLQDEEVYANILKAEKEGMQILAHCNGDMACEQYLNQIEAVYKTMEQDGKPGFYRGDIRPVMVHAQLLGVDQLKAVRRLGVIPSFFLAHVYHWGDVHIRNLGLERASHISPAGSALKEGVVFTLHQDSPVIKQDMLETIWCAAKRETRSGAILGKDERIPVWQALKAVTVHGAYQYFEENEKGTLAVGKAADFAILDKNPLKVETDGIRDIRVKAAVKNDNLLWRA